MAKWKAKEGSDKKFSGEIEGMGCRKRRKEVKQT